MGKVILFILSEVMRVRTCEGDWHLGKEIYVTRSNFFLTFLKDRLIRKRRKKKMKHLRNYSANPRNKLWLTVIERVLLSIYCVKQNTNIIDDSGSPKLFYIATNI